VQGVIHRPRPSATCGGLVCRGLMRVRCGRLPSQFGFHPWAKRDFFRPLTSDVLPKLRRASVLRANVSPVGAWGPENAGPMVPCPRCRSRCRPVHIRVRARSRSPWRRLRNSRRSDLRRGRVCEVRQGFRVDGEVAESRRIRRHVGNRRHVASASLSKASAKEFRRTCTTPGRAASHLTAQGRFAVVPSAIAPVSFKADDFGDSKMEIELAPHRRLSLDPPTPQPRTARPLTHVVVVSVPTSVSGYRPCRRLVVSVQRSLGQIIPRFTGADAVPGRRRRGSC